MFKQLKAIGWYEFKVAAYPKQKSSLVGKANFALPHDLVYESREPLF